MTKQEGVMTRQEKVVLVVAAAVLLAFAGIALWQSARAIAAERRLAAVRTELALQRYESTLALAAIEAGRGSYELARQMASDFFTGLQLDLERAPAEARSALQEVLLQRDSMITALSRSDPQSGPQLVRLLLRYRIALGEPVGPREPAMSAPPPAEQPAPDSTPGG
jgi:hypothetical protein